MFSSFGYQTYCVFVAAAGSGKTPVGAGVAGSVVGIVAVGIVVVVVVVVVVAVVVVVVAVVVGNILVDGSYAGLANQFVAASTTVAVQMPVEARLKDRLRQHQTKRSFAAAKDSFARSQFVPIAFVVALFPSAAAEKKTPRP